MSILNKKRIKKYSYVIKKINYLEKNIKKLSKEEIQGKTREFKAKIKEFDNNSKKIEKYLKEILPFAFAMVREVSKRTLGLRHFDVQMIGAQVLHEGEIAEMKTGEGKTLVIPLAAYLNSLVDKGVHVITVNDYLAKRDKEKMEPIYDYLGISVGLIQNDMSRIERQDNYSKDITYVTNSEVAFDYLKDNLVWSNEDRVLTKGTFFAIIDEIDSILIDEARTPLIISGQEEINSTLYLKADYLAKKLTIEYKTSDQKSKLEKMIDKKSENISDKDVIINKKEKTVLLTDNGIKKVEEFYNISNLGELENSLINHNVLQGIKANYLFEKNIDYLIKEGKIELIDEFTGRVLKGRKYSEGLHQALEAKEKVDITMENKEIAAITYQSFFKLYYKFTGLTGTAKTESEEFEEIYDMLVIEVPTNKTIKRIDLVDKIYKTKKEKYLAIAKEIQKNYKIGRPVLVGTPNVYVSEVLDEILNRLNIPHSVLNAKNHSLEADIIAKAGQLKTITVATNMAGRGTDIEISSEAKKLGGLKVIGVERHSSRRIDNQLRGRSGRQGDNGESVFYLSLEDDLMKLFANNTSINTMFSINTEYGEPIESKMLSKIVENAQRQIEGINFNIRKNVNKYDQIISKQKRILYDDRNLLVEGCPLENYKLLLKNFINTVDIEYEKERDILDIDFIEYLNKNHGDIFELSTNKNFKSEDIIDKEDLIQILLKETENKFDISEEKNKKTLKSIMINSVDNNITFYLSEISRIQKGIENQAFKQQDPLIEFIKETNKLLEEITFLIQKEIIKEFYKNNEEKDKEKNKEKQ